VTRKRRSGDETARTRSAGHKPASIHDVAERAGVSIKTVSRVLNREPNVSDSTREKVQQAVAALSYRPNLFARSLASERSFLIGLLFDNPSAAYIAGVQLGALARCREAGFHLIVEVLDSRDPGVDQAVMALVAESALHGVILTPPLCDSLPILEALTRARVPFVRMAPAHSMPGMAEVFIDDRQAAFEMTSHLISQGHRRIGFIKGHPDHASADLRFEGHRAALSEAGIAYDDTLVAQGQYDFQSGLDAAERLLALTPRPTAIFACNDDMAAGVLAAAQQLNIKAPSELSVAGFDDSLPAQIVRPRLTTVRQPVAEMAAAAVAMLVVRTPAQAPTAQQLAHELLVRDSTAPPRPARMLG